MKVIIALIGVAVLIDVLFAFSEKQINNMLLPVDEGGADSTDDASGIGATRQPGRWKLACEEVARRGPVRSRDRGVPRLGARADRPGNRRPRSGVHLHHPSTHPQHLRQAGRAQQERAHSTRAKAGRPGRIKRMHSQPEPGWVLAKPYAQAWPRTRAGSYIQAGLRTGVGPRIGAGPSAQDGPYAKTGL